MKLAEALADDLTEAVYRTALDPAAWHDVMQLMRQRFPSTAQTFYFLHRESKCIRPVCLAGVQRRWVESFDGLFFTPDNPWVQVTKSLHRPGVVRTTERLERFMREAGVLYRSTYYNEWMRPQGFKHNIGNTLLAEGGVIANITLFRSPDMPTFSDDEVRDFEALSGHMTRALRMSIQLERSEQCPASMVAFDALPHAIALVDARRRILYANAAMETLLVGRRGLRSCQGELMATDSDAQQRFAAHVVAAFAPNSASRDGLEPVLLGGRDGRLSLRAIPVQGAMAPFLPARQTALLMVTECSGQRVVSRAAIVQFFGCTPSEARLAQLLAEGNELREAARAMGVTYGTARGYLKLVFQKTGVRTQAQLVGRILGEGSTSHSAPPLND